MKPILSCWKCGTVADVGDWFEITDFGRKPVRYIPQQVAWPWGCVEGLGGHSDLPPPTPDRLADDGQRVLDNVNRIMLDAVTG